MLKMKVLNCSNRRDRDRDCSECSPLTPENVSTAVRGRTSNFGRAQEKI